MYNIWRRAAVRNTKPNNIRRHRLLAQRRHSIIRNHQRIQRVDAEPGTIRRMGSFAVVLSFDAGEGGGADARAVVEDARVGDEGDVNVFVGACVEEADFAAADAFFAGGAEDEGFAGEGVACKDLRGCEAGGEGGGGDEVVAAGVAEVGERVCES